MQDIILGLQISAYGVLITFLVLGLLILVMILLRGLFSPPLQENEAAAMPEDIPTGDLEEDPTSRLAALTAAWWYWQKKRSSNLGKQLEKGPGKRWRKTDKA